jgi:alpha-N-arabinofuranosidase
MSVPLLRWPGGCYADHYHWRDGIGTRKIRLGMSCGFQVLDDNAIGTHEFLELCGLIGAEPYLAGNVGSGTPQELCDWMEYVNASLPTDLVRERWANGREEPWNVRLWGVGNENWGCGGDFIPRDYAGEYRRFACMLRHVDPKAELILCGHNDEWNREVSAAMADRWSLVDRFSIHRYWIEGGPGEAFSEEQYYRLLVEAEATERFVQDTRSILVTHGGVNVKLALDEWGVWHPEARTFGPDSEDTCTEGFEQACTQRDALAAAIAFEGFHRQSDALSMANLAQIVNVIHAPIRTDGRELWLTPTYHLLKMHRPHHGGIALRCEVEAPVAAEGLAALGATATTQDGKTVLSLTNRHFREPVEVALAAPGSLVQARLLAAGTANAQNSAEEPDAILPNAMHTGWDADGSLIFALPPHSMATLTFAS